jgi:cation:H+ antiporter
MICPAATIRCHGAAFAYSAARVLIALAIVVVVAALVGLVYGADRFVEGAAGLARRFGVSQLIVGMVIVGLGTSAPEMLVSIMAALEGEGGMAIGNAIGSNVSNIGLVLGCTALISSVHVHRQVLRRELPLLFVISAGALLLFIDGELDYIDGGLLVAGLVAVMWRMIRKGAADAAASRKSAGEAGGQGDAGEAAAGALDSAGETPVGDAGAAERSKGGEGEEGGEDDEESKPPPTMWSSTLRLASGLLVLLLSSQGVVWGASTIAAAFGVSDLIIGLTIVAIGTSLPELAASVASAFRGQHEMAVGNVIGSNTFNLLAVLPFPAFLDAGETDPAVLGRDAPVMLGMTVMLMVFAYGIKRRGVIGRMEGAILLAAYLGYLGYLIVVGLGLAGGGAS